MKKIKLLTIVIAMALGSAFFLNCQDDANKKKAKDDKQINETKKDVETKNAQETKTSSIKKHDCPHAKKTAKKEGKHECDHTLHGCLSKIKKADFKELELVHNLVHPLCHEVVKKEDMDEIKSYVTKLEAAMEKVVQAEIPEKIAKNKDKVDSARKELAKSIKECQSAFEKKDSKLVKEGVADIHNKFVKLLSTFKM